MNGLNYDPRLRFAASRLLPYDVGGQSPPYKTDMTYQAPGTRNTRDLGAEFATQTQSMRICFYMAEHVVLICFYETAKDHRHFVAGANGQPMAF